ncbi:MAG: lipopolysaccharide transport periplasmic protein LptA [Acidovorax sp.]
MTHRFSSFLLLVALCLAGTAQAEKADSGKPMNIEADALRHDELKQTSVFTGNVVMTKGTITIRGARLDVVQDADGYQSGTVTAAPGARAFFRQKRDTPPGQPEEWIEGEGEVIEYDGRRDIVKFIRRAEMRRYRGSQLSDHVSGAIIVYNNVTDVFTVDSPKGQPTAAPQGARPRDGRVRATLAPKDSASAPAAPAAPASAPALRPSTTLSQ